MTKENLVAASCALMAFLAAGCGTVPSTPQKAAATPPKTANQLRYSNKWRIEVSEGANSDGEFIFHVTPKGGHTQVVTVAVADGESENHVALIIENAFKTQLDSSKYHVEVDDGEDVLVKKAFGEPRFALEIISSTVKSVRLHLQKE